MSVQFTQAELVAVGERFTSRKFGSQARARNSRCRHGLGSCAWRIHFWYFNLGRLIRCPTGTSGCGTPFPISGIGAQYPAMGELQEFYMHSTDRSLGWPDAPPNEEGGVNTGSALGGYVYGEPDFGVLGEIDRLSCNPLVSLEAECPKGVPTLLPGQRAPETLQEYWELGFLQRGGVDPVAGVSGARMLDSAVSYWEVLGGFSDLHHKCFGGYVPQPLESSVECTDGSDEKLPSQNLLIFFTPIPKGPLTKPAISYEGTCPPGGGNAFPKHIRIKAETPRSYYIMLNDGTINILSKKDYIEGPYKGGGKYQKLDGGQLVRVMNAYLSEFKGSDAQRVSPDFNKNIAKTGFPFRKLLRSQYFGAPNRATWDGTELNIDIPLFAKAPPPGSGTPAPIPAGTAIGGTYANGEGFVTGGLWAKGTKLAQPVTVRMLNGEQEIYRFTLKPGVADPVQTAALESDEAQHLHFFEKAEQGNPIRFVLLTDLVFSDASGQLVIETNDVLAYQPELDDIFLMLRLMTSAGNEGQIGNDVPDANDLWDTWLQYGCVVAGGLIAGEAGAADIGSFELISDNKTYETARRLIRKTTRLFNREQVVGYAAHGGRSILYLRRYNRGLDQMEGLGPSLRPVAAGDLTAGPEAGLALGEGIYPGVKYWVRGAGTVTYNGQTYSGVTSGLHAAHFVGVSGARGYTYTGGAQVFEYEGILHPTGVYKPKQWSNEWVMWSESKPYSYEGPDGPINRLHPSIFGDFYPYFNACHWYSTQFNVHDRTNLWKRMFYSQEIIDLSEGPDAMNFAEGANSGASPDFVRSCQMMKPPPEVDSAVSYLDPALGFEVVKLTFRGRFDTLESAPADVPEDRTQWDLVALAAQPSRTMENGVMEFLAATDASGGTIEHDPSTYRCSVKAGDWAATSHGGDQIAGPDPRGEFGNNIYGSCLPHFFAVKLAEEPPEDGNDNYDLLKDANCLVEQIIDWEIRDRAMAPGFVDSQTSIAVCADTTSLMDFTYENLNFRAHGDRWISPLLSSFLFHGREEGRADLPMGFGPMVRTIMAAGVINKFAANVNLLTEVRFMGPAFTITATNVVGGKVELISKTWGDDCGGTGKVAVFKGVGFSQPDMVDIGPFDCFNNDGICVLSASGSVKVTSEGEGGLLTGCGANGEWRKVSEEIRTRYSIGSAELGPYVHPEVRDLIVNGALYVTGIYSETKLVVHAIAENDPEKVQLCGEGRDPFSNEPFLRDGEGYRTEFENVTDIQGKCQIFALSGEVKVDGVGSGDALVCVGTTTAVESGIFEGAHGEAVSVQKTIAITPNAVPWLRVGLKAYSREDF